MKAKLLSLVLIVAAIAVVGCGSKDKDVVEPPKAATEGGNSVKDPNLQKMIGGSEPAGGGSTGAREGG
jgi:hypothetical protein